MGQRTHVFLTDRQDAFLRQEAIRTGLSMSELVRRAIDAAYRPHRRPRIPGFDVSFGIWSRPDAAVVARRPMKRRLSD